MYHYLRILNVFLANINQNFDFQTFYIFLD